MSFANADLTAVWPWIVDGLVLIGALIALALILDSYRAFLRPRYKATVERHRQNHLSHLRDMLAPALDGLWSNEMQQRMTALVFAQRLAKNRSEAGGLAHILIAFIRHRLSKLADPKNDDGFEDVKLALAVLGMRAVRSAQTDTRQGIDLSGVNFRGVSLYGVDMQEFRMAACILDHCQLGTAKLARADLSGASMIGADLRNANLQGADLSGADVSGADFSGAVVRGMKLNAANISGAVLVDTVGLEQKQIDEALGDSDTAVPEHFRFVPVRTQRSKPVTQPPVRAAE